MEETLKSLKSDSRYTLVFNEIRNFIITNNLQSGDKLPTEKEITEQLGVSRTAVREAIKSMEALGIVEARAGQGMFVRSFNFDPILQNLSYSILFDRSDLANVLEVRKALECFFIEEVVRKISQEEIEQLKRLLVKMEVKGKHGEQIAPEDSEFHQTIFKVVNNDLLLKLLHIFWKLLKNARDEGLIEISPEVDSVARHRKIVKAVEKRDVEAAQISFFEHFESIEKRIRKATLRR